MPIVAKVVGLRASRSGPLRTGVLAWIFFLAQAAIAQAGPIIRVQFASGHSFTSFGTFLDQSFEQENLGGGEGRIELVNGTWLMRARMASANPGIGTFQVGDLITDTFTFHTGGGPEMVTIKLDAEGTVFLPFPGDEDPVYGNGQDGIFLAFGGAPEDSQFHGFTNNPNGGTGVEPAQPGIPIVVFEHARQNIPVFDGFTVSADFGLRLAGSNGVALDFFATAGLSFDLPPGVSVTSEGGVFQTGEVSGPSVPEPSSLLLISMVVPVGAVLSWRRSRLSRG